MKEVPRHTIGSSANPSCKLLTAVLAGGLAGGLLAGCAADDTDMNTPAEPTIGAEFPFESRFIEILGSQMHYVDEGQGDPILFLHGNPTSSYLWRNIIPHVTDDARAIAVDLIGMGKSDKPDLEYRFVDHARYLEAFIEALDLRNITLVVHDWGSGLGFNYAANNEANIKGIAMMEALIRPYTWETLPPGGSVEMLTNIRTPGVGEDMLMNQNLFVERNIPAGVVRPVSEEEMNRYREPYPTPESRLPVWKWPNEIPISGEPADVHEIVANYYEWLQATQVPKLLFHATPGLMIRAPDVERARQELPNLETVPIGPGRHFVQEDNPHTIGEVLAEWFRRI